MLSEDKTTYNTVAQLQRQLRPVLEALSKITVTLARFYGIECEDGEPAIEFGDSVFEDTEQSSTGVFSWFKRGCSSRRNSMHGISECRLKKQRRCCRR